MNPNHPTAAGPPNHTEKAPRAETGRCNRHTLIVRLTGEADADATGLTRWRGEIEHLADGRKLGATRFGRIDRLLRIFRDTVVRITTGQSETPGAEARNRPGDPAGSNKNTETGIGIDQYIRFRPTPIVGADLVTSISQGASGQSDTTALRIPLGGKLEIFLPFLNDIFPGQMEALGLKKFGDSESADDVDSQGKGAKLYIENQFHYTPDDNNAETHNFFEAGFVFPFNEATGISVVYQTGELAPAYKNTESFKVNFTARF
ncbi:MAG: hypothetical protein OXR84_11810 [Magnetovibrio sp.]|nr:hypothetical protein [Magnetovibrio sp.]